jgi:hypothetical protein
MTGPASHPPWCDLSRCGVAPDRPTGTHCSRLVVLGPYPPSTVVAEVSVAQGPPVPGYPWSGRPFVALALGDGDGDDELCLTPLPVELASGLGRVLIGLAREVAS